MSVSSVICIRPDVFVGSTLIPVEHWAVVMSTAEGTKKLMTPFMIGFLGPLVALVCIAIAIFISPWFSWFDNALSDLGNYNNGMAAAVVFNAGLIVTAVLMLYFAVTLLRALKDWPTRIALIILVVSLGFLASIGVFSENFGSLHFYVSVGFFLTFPFAMWTIAISWLRYRKLWWFCLISFLLPFVSFYMWTSYFGGALPWTGVAIPEIVTSVTAIGWILVINLLHKWGLLKQLAEH